MDIEKYTLILGDCIEQMKNIPSNTIDMVLCDLPYGITHCKWDTIIPFDELWEQYDRICKENAAICLFGVEPFASKIRLSNLDDYRYDWIWEKTQGTGHLNAKKMPLRCHESICVFYKKLPTYNPIKTYGHKRKVATANHKRNSNTGEIYGKCDKFSDYDSTERYPRSVIKFASDKQKENYHSTQKPVALCQYLIKTYSNEGDLILDNTMGSGTTGVACLKENRRFIGIEKDAKYFDIATERLKKIENE